MLVDDLVYVAGVLVPVRVSLGVDHLDWAFGASVEASRLVDPDHAWPVLPNLLESFFSVGMGLY